MVFTIFALGRISSSRGQPFVDRRAMHIEFHVSENSQAISVLTLNINSLVCVRHRRVKFSDTVSRYAELSRPCGNRFGLRLFRQ